MKVQPGNRTDGIENGAKEGTMLAVRGSAQVQKGNPCGMR